MEPKVLTETGGRGPARRRRGAEQAGAAILRLPGFLDQSSCNRIRRAMDAGAPEPAAILNDVVIADEGIRRATHIEVDAAILAHVEERLDGVRDETARFFHLPLAEREGASLLRYVTGSFFRLHRDWGEVPSWPGAARRRIAIVLFLTTSTAADPSGTFSGGTLRLFADETAAPLEMHPRAGTLIAFPATILHEVTPVTSGVRDTVVDWFY